MTEGKTRAGRIATDPSAPYWLRELADVVGAIDPVDALNGLEALTDALEADYAETLRTLGAILPTGHDVWPWSCASCGDALTDEEASAHACSHVGVNG